MNNLSQAVWTEYLKARRSSMPLFSMLGIAMLPLIGGLFMIILKDPEFARRMGLISTKARLAAGVADWPAYLNMLCLGLAAGGMILFSLVGSWIFGREFADRTAKDLLALPTSRAAIVSGKFIIFALWSVILTGVVLILGIVVGYAVALPPVNPQIILQGFITLLTTALLTLVCIPPIIFFASAGRGYLPAVGVAILAIVLAQIAAALGWGDLFPWSIAAMVAQGNKIGGVSYLIVVVTGFIGVFATYLWWQYADQSH